jgi:hypothetical protein
LLAFSDQGPVSLPRQLHIEPGGAARLLLKPKPMLGIAFQSAGASPACTGPSSELETRTLLCGDLFTQGGSGAVAITESDILAPSEAFRQPMDYYAHAPHTGATLEKLAKVQPQVLACMHGSAWRGDGASLLRALARVLTTQPALATAA